MYCAGVAELYRHFASPRHEAIAVGGSQSTVYTAYLVAVAGFGKLFGLTPYRALQVAGIFNIAGYVGGALYLFSRVSIHRRFVVPTACFLLVSSLLRWHHFGWSSETCALLMPYLQAYPSTLAWALAFMAFGLMEAIAAEGHRRHILLLFITLAALLLTHVLTASWVIGIIGLRGLYLCVRDRNAWILVKVALIVSAAFLVASLWPYYSFFGQSTLMGVKESSSFGANPFTDFLSLYVVAIPCALWLMIRLRSHRFWLAALAASWSALTLWHALGIDYGNRYSFFMAFCAQLIVAETVAAGSISLFGPLSDALRREPDGDAHAVDRGFSVAMAVIAVVATWWSPVWSLAGKNHLKGPLAIIEAPSFHDRYYRAWEPLEPYLTGDDVILMPVSREVFDLSSTTGAKMIGAPNAQRVPDRRRRNQDVRRFLRHTTPASQRLEIIARYGVTHILLRRRALREAPAIAALFGKPVYRDETSALFTTDLVSRRE